MYTVKVNQKYSYNIDFSDEGMKLDDQLVTPDMIKTSNNKLHFIRNNQSYNIEILNADYQNKTFELSINGKIQTVEIKDDMDLLLESMGMDLASLNKVNTIPAPMPGLVLDVLVEVGMEVEKGTGLLVLEAMKMENLIKSPGSGKIKAVNIAKNDKVEKNQVMIELE